MNEPGLDLDNDFWRFSLAAYAAPGVAAECLALQASHAIDVNLLLFGAWAGAARGWQLERADVERLQDSIRDLQERIIKPLRSARGASKAMAGVPTFAGLKTAIAECELAAEHIEQALLFAQAPASAVSGSAALVHANIAVILDVTARGTGDRWAFPEALIKASLAVSAAAH
jgi:uncharacterized protein (TIGR02444 family)